MIPKFLNFITLVPDSKFITIDSNSKSGWYILYAPDQNQKQAESGTPIPIFVKNGDPNYYGWTTRIPIGCRGHANFQVGRCKLVYQNLEDSLSGQGSIDSFAQVGNIAKSLVSVQGRILYPKLPENPINDNTEYYCFYAKLTSCPKFNPKFLPEITPFFLENNWKIGFITYSDILASALVPASIFGVPLEGTYRYIGECRSYFESLLPVISTQSVQDQIPLMENIAIVAPQFFIKQSFPLIYLFFSPTTIRILPGSNYFGTITTDKPEILITYLNNAIIELTNCLPDFIVDCRGLVWETQPIEIYVTAGNFIFPVQL